MKSSSSYGSNVCSTEYKLLTFLTSRLNNNPLSYYNFNIKRYFKETIKKSQNTFYTFWYTENKNLLAQSIEPFYTSSKYPNKNLLKWGEKSQKVVHIRCLRYFDWKIKAVTKWIRTYMNLMIERRILLIFRTKSIRPVTK